ncbi:MAG: hypothetical protein IJT79_08475 [Ruminococcus sp.]|nr:hypothetical protein [Ruminococcus sp.]
MNNILIDPKTGEEYVDVPPSAAAKYLGVTVLLVREGLKSGALPIGAAVQPKPNGKWIFNIPIARLKAYREASDLNLKSALAELMKSTEGVIS